MNGSAMFSSPGDAAAAEERLNVRGLEPRAFVRIQLNTIDGKQASAGTVLIVPAHADRKRAVVASGGAAIAADASRSRPRQCGVFRGFR